MCSHVQRVGIQSAAIVISAGKATNQEAEASFHILKLILLPNVPINSSKVLTIVLI